MSHGPQRGFDRGGGGRPQQQELNHRIMTEYHDPQGHLKREVFVDWPKRLARDLGDTRTSLRRLFDHVASMRFRIRMGENPAGVLQEGMGALHRFAQYQGGRGIIRRETREFIQTHCDAVRSDAKKFEGFYQLFQSVMAHLGR